MTDILGETLNMQYALLLPEILLGLTAVVVVFADLFSSELKIGYRLLPLLTVAGLVAALATSLLWVDTTSDFALLVRVDAFTTFFRVIFCLVAIALVVGAHEYIEAHVNHPGEFFALLLLSTAGASFMAGAQDLLTAYLAVEVLSFSLYIAVSLGRNDPRSGEAALKYVLLGGVASAFLLYGLSFVYGVAGSTQYSLIAEGLAGDISGVRGELVLGLVLIVAGLGFKASAVPFHMWTPDAYEGAPIPVTAYLSATSKAATFALLLRWFSGPLLPAIEEWQWMIAVIATATMVLGNLVALQQRNIKRLLAYSSIAQVGFMLMALVGMSQVTASGLLVHLGGYLITNLTVFIAVIHFYNRTGKEEISDFKGLAQTNPYLALVITAGLFSLAGMPLLVGFFTKFMLFQSVVEADFLWLVVVAVVGSTVSLFYYLQVIKQMYLYQPDGDAARWRLTPTGYLSTGLLLVAVVVLGIWGTPLYQVADHAAAALFPV
ncbi:MAG: NADH-quinone oxidoreductase subunit N [Dehalococcoidia bacterium]|nr:MAG: NADH-quinone oxidoreductase subunit N [Dehalococcoidia bacterium]